MGESSKDPNTTLDQVKDQVWEAADKTSKAVEEGIQAASYAVKSGTVKAREEYAKAVESSQVMCDSCWISFFQSSPISPINRKSESNVHGWSAEHH